MGSLNGCRWEYVVGVCNSNLIQKINANYEVNMGNQHSTHSFK